MSMSRVILFVVGLNTLITVGTLVGGYLYLRPMLESNTQVAPVAAQIRRPSSDYMFYPIEKIVVNLPGPKRERYVVLDLALQGDEKMQAATLKQLEPLVRHSVISSLSQLSFEELRKLAIGEVQTRIESRLREDFASKSLTLPFSDVLVSKFLVQ